jgi:hypothetical protein
MSIFWACFCEMPPNAKNGFLRSKNRAISNLTFKSIMGSLVLQIDLTDKRNMRSIPANIHPVLG